MTNEASGNEVPATNDHESVPPEVRARLAQLRSYAARVTSESERHLAERDLADERIRALQTALESLQALAQATDDVTVLRQAIAELSAAALSKTSRPPSR